MTGTDLVGHLHRALGPEAEMALRVAEDLARASGVSLYLVGGAVRDLMLDRPHLDLDLATEGDVEPFARAVAEATGARMIVHSRFGTAVLKGAGFDLDFTRTRSERYARPGTLPTVAPAPLAADLARRDFTMSAVALRLAPPPGEIIDPFGGVADIEARLVRVLHGQSFQDDATRILRAVRYAARLGLTIESKTLRWLQRDLPFLGTISGPRLRRELELLFREARTVEAAELASSLGVLTAVHPALSLTPRKAATWRRALAGDHHASRDELAFCLLADCQGDDDVESLARRLHLTRRQETALRARVRLRSLSDKLGAPAASPADAAEAMDGISVATLWAVASDAEDPLAPICERYLRLWRRVRPALRGDDVMALGLAGVQVGEALRLLRRAHLEGRVVTRQEEIRLIRAEFDLREGGTR